MPYAFIQDVPADEAIYRQILELLPAGTPAGLITHLAVKHEGGLRYIDVWETQADWDRFHHGPLQPAVDKVLDGLGIPHSHEDVMVEELDVIDVWRGER